MKTFCKPTFCVVLAISCSCRIIGPKETGTSGYIFPLEIGTSWKYENKNVWCHYVPYEEGCDFDSTPRYDTITMTIVRRDTLENGMPCFIAQELTGEAFREEWLANTDSGLYSYKRRPLYMGPYIPAVLFKASRASADSDTVTVVFNEPLRILKYPLAVGERWVWSPTFGGEPHVVEKHCVAKQIIAIPAGQYSCYRITREFQDSVFLNQQLDEYFGEFGLIKRTMVTTVEDMRIDPSNPGRTIRMGTLDICDTMVMLECCVTR
jgi:hypothetical protein